MVKDRKQEARQHDKLFCLLSFYVIPDYYFTPKFQTDISYHIFLQRQLGNPSHLFSKRTLSNIKKTEIKHFPILLFVITEIIYTFAIQGLHFKAYRK